MNEYGGSAVWFYLHSYGYREAMHSLNPEKQEGVVERPIQNLKPMRRVWNNTATEIKLKG